MRKNFNRLKVPFMSMNPDFMIACRYTQLQDQIDKRKRQIEINKNLMWSKGFFGKCKLIWANSKLKKEYELLKLEQAEIFKKEEGKKK